MGKHNNMQEVRNLLVSKGGIASLNEIKKYFSSREGYVNVKKVLNPMVERSELIENNGQYTLNADYNPPIRQSRSNKKSTEKKSSKNSRPFISYPNAILDYTIFDNFIEKNDLNHDDKIILLNQHNSQIVENLIKNDSKYEPKAKNLYKALLDDPDNKQSFNFNDGEKVDKVIAQIDIDNSTFDIANSRRKGNPTARESFVDYILKQENDFVSKLNGNAETIKQLVEDLRLSHQHYNPKSLASKVCKYFHEYYFDNDKFFINDKVVRSVLPYYLDYYGIEHNLNTANNRNLSYCGLYDYLEKLREAAKTKHGEYIKRSELDHILWYCYKIYKNKEL